MKVVEASILRFFALSELFARRAQLPYAGYVNGEISKGSRR
jgi:hypothetical protein